MKLIREHGGLGDVLEHLREKCAFPLRSLVTLTDLLGNNRAAAKGESAEEGKKKKGGISIPEEWPWEEAKKVFEKPDVKPADEVEVWGIR